MIPGRKFADLPEDEEYKQCLLFLPFLLLHQPVSCYLDSTSKFQRFLLKPLEAGIFDKVVESN